MVQTPGGTDGAPPLRRLNEPSAIAARAGDDGAPEALRLGPPKAGWLEVLDVLDRWRTDDRWWTELPVSRAYYELLLEDGRTVTVFRDDVTDSWWEQRYH